MQNNRPITIYTARSRHEKQLQAAPTDVKGLFDRLGQSQVLPLIHGKYMRLKKTQQDDLKDVGAYIAGTLKDGRRRNGCVLTRCAVVLDADNLPSGGTEEFIRRVDALGVCSCIHSTAKHTPTTPRLRAVFPLVQDIPAEQYAPVARELCLLIQPDMTWFDPSTDQAGRLMYNPTHCQDVELVYHVTDKPLLDAAALLEKELPDWEDPTRWPRFPKEPAPARLAAKQQDPTAKSGIVGAFCRVYDVPAAMDKFLPGVYDETASEGRYTFSAGSTYGGAVVYENGKFLYSHHATDPAGGRLVNAFDLVRIHLFADLDEVEGSNRGNTLPSYFAMEKLAREDEAVANELARERLASTKADFQDEAAALELARYEKEPFDLNVLRAALRAMGTQVRRNLITGRVEITGMPPRYSLEEAVNTLPVILWDMLKPLKIKGASITAIQQALGVLADENRFNPVLDMLRATNWDGVNRLPALLKALNLDIGSFYALLIRKWLIQCVALVHNGPRHQEPAEGVLTLQGPQGVGKTTLLRRLAIKSEWFAEGVTLDLKNKDDILRAIGVWITELGELESTLKKEQTSLKSFITQKVDRVRAPYAPEATDRPRRTSFGATVNPDTFLKDDTGDRRFWVVPVTDIDIDALLALSDDWFTQLWAEVYIWWQENPQGFRLSRTEREHLDELNRQYREFLPGELEILELLDFTLPPDRWSEFTPTQLVQQHLYGMRVTSQQAGRVLTKLAREDSRITFSIDRHKVRSYRLPILPDFADTAGDAETNSNGHKNYGEMEK